MPKTRYAARAWLFLGGQRKSLPTRDGLSRGSIRKAVYEFHKAIDQKRGDVALEDICVELFLPDQLFEEEIDQFPVEVPGQPDPLPIGQLHPLVLRWDDRAVQPRLRDDPVLRARFERLSTGDSMPRDIPAYDPDAPLGACAWVEPDRWKGSDVHVWVSREKKLVLCLLTRAPRGDVTRSALRGLLTAGVPAVLWSRAPEPSTEPLEELVAGRAPCELSSHVFEARRRPAHPLREHLSLLYENPNRMPPRPKRLGAPSKRGPT
jgi:hypothetical protein